MKTRQSRRKTAKVSHPRWLAYATASAATALAGSHSAEGAIHYSGRLLVPFTGAGFNCGNSRSQEHTFQLDQAGDSLRFNRILDSDCRGIDSCHIFGAASAAARGAVGGNSLPYLSKLSTGQIISSGPFVFGGEFLFIGSRYNVGYWTEGGTGFIGFKFNNGGGVQYGWVRIKMHIGMRLSAGFVLRDYAYADPGEPIRAGQTSSDEQAPDQSSTDEQAPDQGSLGGLALGAVGLLAWRKGRSRTARLEST